MASASRIARAAGAAALSTLAALTMHVAAGGDAPAAAGILVPLAVSFAVGVQLAGRPLGRLRLGLLVAVSQFAFHAAFAFGSSSAAPSHAHHGTTTLGALDVSAHARSMPAAHVAAALVSYAVIRRADTLLAALARLGDLVARALVTRLRLADPFMFRSVAPPQRFAAPRSRYGRPAVHAPATRGPPAIA